MEFDIVELGNEDADGNGMQLSMEFDTVELQSWNDRTRKKFADRAERRKSWHQLSLCENELAMCCVTGSTVS